MPAQNEVSLLVKREVSLLYVDPPTWEELQAGRHGGRRFTIGFPRAIARATRPASVTIVATDGDYPGLFVALVRTVQTISTLDTRVTFDLIRPVSPYTLEGLVEGVDTGFLDPAVNRVAVDGGHALVVIPRQVARTLMARLVARADNDWALRPIIAYLSRPERYLNARALQHDALELALRAFGASPEPTELVLSGRDTALDRIAIQEDIVVQHDARWIPGWRLEDSYLTGRAVFRKGADELQVFTANKLPLEELFGVDLIYLNEPRRSLVMVQYKMMEGGEHQRPPFAGPGPRGGKDWTVPIDEQFLDQVRRMGAFECDPDAEGPYRLNPGAFYFKLVKRDAETGSYGIILSLDHLRHMLAEGRLRGPRNGLRISYSELDGHYLKGEVWIELVRSGYIGSRGATTMHMQALIEEAIHGGRAAVAAINRRLHP